MKLTLQKSIKDPAGFTWLEVSEVQHYWLEFNAITGPMVVGENSPQYRINTQ